MKLSGKSVINNTYLYIYPCLRDHGKELMLRMRSFYKLAVTIGDDYDMLDFGQYVYVTFSNIERSPGYLDRFGKFLNWIREQEYYVKDYSNNEVAHTVVLKLPDRFYDLPARLIDSKYKGIYNKDELEEFYKKDYISLTEDMKKKVMSVVLGSKEYFPTFVKNVNERFATEFTEDDLKHIEDYEIGLIMSENVLNYNVNVLAGQ